MASINIVFRRSARSGRHTGSLSLRLIHCRQVKTITLAGCRVYEEEWDRQSQTIRIPADDPPRAEYLHKVETVLRYAADMIAGFIPTLESQGRYTLDDLLALYRVKKNDGKLLSYTESLAERMSARGQYRTARAYRTVVRGLVRFNKGEDIPLHQINSCLIKDFETHLKEQGRLPNTISYYMRNLRAIYNKAVAENRIIRRPTENPFQGVYLGVTRTMKRSLSIDELQRLLDLDLMAIAEENSPKDPSKDHYKVDYLHRLSASHRYFGFCFYARGMSFIDLAFLQKSNIRGGIIRYVRKKTGQQIEIRITPELQSIIDSFAHETAGSNYVFPIIRDSGYAGRMQYESAMRVQNNRLKKLSSLAGIGRKISTHWARHSWATVGKLVNLPLKVISECLGHTSENTTMIYLAQLNNTVLDEANERIAYAVSHPQSLTGVLT